MTEETQTHSTEAYKWDGLVSLVERTNRNLAKKGYEERVGLGEPTFYVGEVVWTDDSVWPPLRRVRKEQMVRFEIFGVSQVSGGAQFIAAIDHVGDQNIVVPMSAGAEETLGPEYFESLKTCGSTCDHCGTNRNRSQTVVVLKDGALLRVGKSCLQAYLDCPAALSIWRFLYSATDLMNASDDEEGGFGRTTGYDTETVIAATLRLTENGKSYDKAYVNTHIHKFFSPKGFPGLKPLTSEEFEKAAEVIAWAFETFTGKNSYEHNVLTFLQAEWVRFKYLNFVIGVVAAWHRAKTIRAEKATKCNEHFGTEKQKVELDLTLVKTAGFETQYGYTTIYMFEDEEGRSFKWFTGTALRCPFKETEELEIGTKLKLKGTIKGHGEYKERKETILTRCKLVEVLVADAPSGELCDLEDADLLRLDDRAHRKPALWTQEVADAIEDRQAELFGEVFTPDGRWSRGAETRAFNFWSKRRCPVGSFSWMVLEANLHRLDELNELGLREIMRGCDASHAASFPEVIAALIASDVRRDGRVFDLGRPRWAQTTNEAQAV